MDVDSRGPIAYQAQARPSVSAGRVEVKNFHFDPTTIPHRPGRASWIWLPKQSPNERPIAAHFRKVLVLPVKPKSAQVWFCADAHARIYINGFLAARGPDDGGQDYPGTQTGKWFVGYRELSPYFRAGKNVIAVEVFGPEPMEGRFNTTGTSGLLLEGVLHFASGSTTHFETSPDWKGDVAGEWRFADWRQTESAQPERALQFDAGQEPVSWRRPEFDDSAWAGCAQIESKWPDLVQSEIPARMEAIYSWQSVLRPTQGVVQNGSSIRFESDGSCAVRFDRVLSGFIGLRLNGKAGTILAIQPNEPNEPGYHRMATVLLRDGEQELELPFYDSFSVINLVAKNVTGPLEIRDIRANFVAQPVTYRGSFSCSDPKLTEIWNASRWLTEICQQTHHLDSPHHQEPICDFGDYLIISANNYQAFGQPWLARQDLRKFAWLLKATRYRPFHTSYALLWLQTLMSYVDHTGDHKLLHELEPTVHALLDQFSSYIGRNGIISEAPDYMFMDWVTIAGFGAHHPPAVIGQGYMTAFYYRALADGIRVAEESKDQAREAKYTRQREEIKRAFNRELWDEEAGLYRDGLPFVTSVKPADWLPADKDIKTHSAQCNALAVLYDLAPADRQAPIVRRLLAREMNVQPYFMHFVFDAINHAGLFSEFGTELMRKWKIEPDTQSFREMWGTGDYSHAWQCTPLYQMSSKILGISPGSPGFKTIVIRPQLCDLTWAKGAVPTPQGNIEVSWRRRKTGLTLNAKIPAKLRAFLDLSAVSKTGILKVDGTEIPISQVELKPGVHRIQLAY